MLLVVSTPDDIVKFAPPPPPPPPLPLTTRLGVFRLPPVTLSVPPPTTDVVLPTTRPLVASSVSDEPRNCPAPTATLVGPVAALVNELVPAVHAAGSKK